jgi:hypothetical protein
MGDVEREVGVSCFSFAWSHFLFCLFFCRLNVSDANG